MAIKNRGKLPVIDIESCFNPGKLDAKEYAKSMDKNAIALVAFSPQVSREAHNNTGELWTEDARRAVAVDPTRFIPATVAGIYPVFTQDPLLFVDKTISMVEKDHYPLMGEFEFRHYMSPRQFKKGAVHRDVTVPIDSVAGHRLFRFSARTGISFQIHYEIEDVLLKPLEEMLARYPNARVVWCHLAQVRYPGRAKQYNAAYVRKLIEKHPHIYFDLAFGNAKSVYPGSGEYQSTVWERTGRVKQVWIELICDHPYRFLAALDIGGDRMDHVDKNTNTLRTFMGHLPGDVQEIVAYKAAWQLLFNEKW